MEPLNRFSIPIRGLKNEAYQFNFTVDREFFAKFSGSPIEKGQFEVALDFDKRPDMFVLDFTIQGTYQTDCDRCLAPIHLPIENREQLIIKFSDESTEIDEVVYISPDTTQLNVATYIYEFICLAIPMIKIYDCEEETPRPCDIKVLERLEEPPADKVIETKNPIWDALNKLSKDN